MGKRRREEGGERKDGLSSECNVVFLDTSLDTHLALFVSDSDTVFDFKKRMEMEHMNCFPEIGKINIRSLKIKRGANFYHIPESMVVWSVFLGEKEAWSLSADVSKAIKEDLKIDAKNASYNDDDLLLPCADFENNIVVYVPSEAEIAPAENRSEMKLLGPCTDAKADLVAVAVTTFEVEKSVKNTMVHCSSTFSDGASLERETRSRKKRKVSHKVDELPNTFLEEGSLLSHDSVKDPSYPKIVSSKDSMIGIADEELGGLFSRDHHVNLIQVKVTTDDSGKSGEASKGLLSPSMAEKGIPENNSQDRQSNEIGMMVVESERLFAGKKSTKSKRKKKDMNNATEIFDTVSGEFGKTESSKLPCVTQNVGEDKDILSSKDTPDLQIASEFKSPEDASLDLSQNEAGLLPPKCEMKPEISDVIKMKKKKKKKNCVEANIDNLDVEKARKESTDQCPALDNKENGIVSNEGIDSQLILDLVEHANDTVQNNNPDMADSMLCSQGLHTVNDEVNMKGNIEEIIKENGEIPVLEKDQVPVESKVNSESKDEKSRKRTKRLKTSGLEDELQHKSEPAEANIDQVTELKVSLSESKESKSRKAKKKSKSTGPEDKLLDKSEASSANKENVTVSNEDIDSQPKLDLDAHANGDNADSMLCSHDLQTVNDAVISKGSMEEITKENKEIPPLEQDQIPDESKVNSRKRKKRSKTTSLEDKLQQKTEPAEANIEQATELRESKVNLAESNADKSRKTKKDSKSTGLEDKLQDQSESALNNKENGIVSHEEIDSQLNLDLVVHSNGDIEDSMLCSQDLRTVNDAVNTKGIMEEFTEENTEIPVLEKAQFPDESKVNSERKDVKSRKRTKRSKRSGLEDKLQQKSEPAEANIDQATESNNLKENLKKITNNKPGKVKKNSKSTGLEDKLPDKSEASLANMENVIVNHEGIDSQLKLDLVVHANDTVQDNNRDKADSMLCSQDLQTGNDAVNGKGNIEEITKENTEIPILENVQLPDESKVNSESKHEKSRKRTKRSKTSGLEDKLQQKSEPAVANIDQVKQLNNLKENLEELKVNEPNVNFESKKEQSRKRKKMSIDNKASNKETMIVSPLSEQETTNDAFRSLQKSNAAIEESLRSNSTSDFNGNKSISFREYFVPGKQSHNDEIATEECVSNDGIGTLKKHRPDFRQTSDDDKQGGSALNSDRDEATSNTSRKPETPALPSSVDKSSACNSETSPQEKFRIVRLQKKSLSTRPVSIFESDSSDHSYADGDENVHSGNSTKITSSSSSESDHTDGESELSHDSHRKGTGKTIEKSNGKIEKLPVDGLGSKDMTMAVILRSSKMFRKALQRVSSQPEPLLLDSELQEFVPDSQPL